MRKDSSNYLKFLLKDTPTRVHTIDAKLFLLKVPLEVLQNSVFFQLIVMHCILEKVQGKIKEVCQIIKLRLLIGTRGSCLDIKSRYRLVGD